MSEPRSLPLAEWPEADRTAWQQACAPGLRLRRGGRASHLKPVTRNDLARRYGYFLDYLDRTGRLDRDAVAGRHVTPQNVDGFLIELRNRVSSVTQYGSIYKLRRTAELIAPDLDLSWLREIENDLALVMKPRSKHGRIVLSEVLVEAGQSLMIEADAATHRSALWRARQFRDGLMLALLACKPIRLKNFAALTIGRSFVAIENDWWIVLDATETKEARPDEGRVPSFLVPYVEAYVTKHRPVLARADDSGSDVGPSGEQRSAPDKAQPDEHAAAPDALWLSSNDGTPMSYAGVETAITRTVEAAVGVTVSPHLFRACGVTTAAIHAPNQPHLGSAHLNHRDPRVTAQHYNRATSLSAGQKYLEVIRGYEQAKP